MAFTAILFMLLFTAVPILANKYMLPKFGTDKLPLLATTNDLPEEYPAEREEDTHFREWFPDTTINSCPPFGHPDNSYNVTVLGTIAPKIGGCASLVPPKPDILPSSFSSPSFLLPSFSSPSFNLWLGSPKTGGGKCGDKSDRVCCDCSFQMYVSADHPHRVQILKIHIDMDHYIFECRYKFMFFSEERTLEGWNILLYDELWAGHPEFRCALYETVREDPPMFKMVISGTHSCEGLSKRMEQSEQAVPEGSRHIADGSIALIFSRDFPLSPM